MPRSTNRLRSAVFATVVAAVTATLSIGMVTSAHADDSSTLTVVGTSDVYDSNLVQSVIKPGFEAYEQSKGTPVTLNYVSKGTGAAISYAEAGTASALLVHAPALENQFVADGYSLEPAGRAIFWGDFVLLGPASDPAHIMTDAPHDIAKAFEDIAAAGANGTANFVSRGGTPGTTVAEHAIWQLTTGVTTCTVSAANGGGTVPSTTSGDCPSTVTSPDWYHTTGLTQGPNVLNADACNGYSTSNDCYVLTDRGTFNYLQSQDEITTLKIVTRDNSPTAPGGVSALVNSFHAYGINPAKFTGTPGVQINTTAATAFLNWITSPAAQKAIGSYLNSTNDPPFLPDAAPALTASKPTASLRVGQQFTIHGTLKNVVPGMPALNKIKVHLEAQTSASAPRVTVATATTNATGAYTLSYKPKRQYIYTVATDALVKVENSTLDPPFFDQLQATSTPVGTVKVRGLVQFAQAPQVVGHQVRVAAALSPAALGSTARVVIWVHNIHAKPGVWRRIVTWHPRAGVSVAHHAITLRSGTWRMRLVYTNAGLLASHSGIRLIHVG